MLPRVISQLEDTHLFVERLYHTNKKYFYDFNKNAYIDTKFDERHIGFRDDYDICTLGRTSSDGFNKNIKESQLFPVPRTDGKDVCRLLRDARKKLAEANGIDFFTEECIYDGPCGGTCPKCDEELRFLSEELEKIPYEKRVYLELDIETAAQGEK